MPNIVPNSTVRLLTNCPLDKTYDHTIFFATRSAQTSYFEGLVKSPASTYTFTDVSYTRKDRGLKLQAPVGANLYDCNYMMFKNTAFENKWFYAFVTKVEYINNITWEIEFELDDMQTWFFDYELERCFVEREHSRTDAIGDNLVPENLEIGDYISDGVTRCADEGSNPTDSMLRPLSIVFACTFDNNFDNYYGGYYGGVYSGLFFKRFDIPTTYDETEVSTLLTNIRTWLDNAVHAGKADGIVTCFVMPTHFVTLDNAPAKYFNTSFYKTKKYQNSEGSGAKLYGFHVKNNKLFTYPYNFLYVTNFHGDACAYQYEYFAGTETYPNRCFFTLQCNYAPSPSVILTPLNYKGVPSTEDNYDEKMVLGGYPQLPFTTDVFRAWLANGANEMVLSTAMKGVTAGALAGTMIMPGTGTVAGATVGFIGAILGAMRQTIETKIKPPQSHTGCGSGAMVAYRMLDFGFMNKHIRPEFAHIIDDYFNMFGYATHRCKEPNRNVRPHWTYTKTVGCCVKGEVPADSMAHICQIYDKGITFWANGSEVGRYDLDNRPT